MKPTILALVGLTILCACGTLFQKADEHGNIPPAPGATQTNLVLSPAYGQPLETVKDSGLPYASEAAGVILAVLTGYAAIRNRRLKKTATVLTENITTLAPTAEEIVKIKDAQDAAGVREEVRSILK